MRILNSIIVIWALAMCLVIISTRGCEGSQIPQNLAVRAIIGEASGEGLEGMRCVASAIRNRGNLKGVYGLKARHVDKQPKWVWKLARKAWKESATNDFSCKATHWEGTKFKTPYWAKNMILVKRVNNQNFYKQRDKS